MHALKNTLLLAKIAKNYLSDINRIWKIDQKKLKKYQSKTLCKLVKYAYTVPLYRDKYKEKGIYPSDIKSIDDIHKLPIITKNDIRKYYPNGIIPDGFDKDNAFILSTSGSTGRPLNMFYDRLTIIKLLGGYVRALRVYGGNWRNSKIALLVDMKPGSIEQATFSAGLPPFLNKIFSLNNIKMMHIGNKIETLVKELDEFKPDFIGSDPTMFLKVANLKNNGLGENINPKCIFCSGSMLDEYTRNYVEQTFRCRLFNVYAATEAGVIAFECKNKRKYHINSDFVYLEFLDENNKPVKNGKSGRIVLTRLFGKATPIIRYNGLGDFVKPIKEENNCGIQSNKMLNHIEGRKMDFVILPDGREIAPFEITTIPATVMKKLNSFKIKQFQIIQHKINQIEVLLVLDDEKKKNQPSDGEIINEIKKMFKEKTSEDVEIIVTKSKEIEKDKISGHVTLLISKVNR